MNYFEEFKRENTIKYIELYKTGSKQERELLKRNLYNNVNLTEKQKDKFWSSIVKKVKVAL